jgi:hypothetical protein
LPIFLDFLATETSVDRNHRELILSLYCRVVKLVI